MDLGGIAIIAGMVLIGTALVAAAVRRTTVPQRLADRRGNNRRDGVANPEPEAPSVLPGRVEDVKGVRVIHRGEGAYPHPCAFCGRSITIGEVFVVLEDSRVLHEVCAFLLDEEEDV